MKKQFLPVVFTGCCIGASFFLGCNKDNGAGPLTDSLQFHSIGSISHLPGFGDSDELPEGIPFELPKGLRFVDRPGHRFDPDIRKLKGNMNTFYVDVHIVADSNWSGGEYVFPEGLVVVNTAPSRIQNGMLMDREPVTIPVYDPTGGKDTSTYYLGVACMNAGKGLPWADNFGTDDRNYAIAKGLHKPYVVTTNPEVLKFLSLLKGKEHLRLTRHYNPWDRLKEDYVEPEWLKPYGVIQDMFWKMTDGPGLTKSDLEELMEALRKK